MSVYQRNCGQFTRYGSTLYNEASDRSWKVYIYIERGNHNTQEKEYWEEYFINCIDKHYCTQLIHWYAHVDIYILLIGNT